MKLRMHVKRDETESFRAYGRGIAFYVGEPCGQSNKCNDILFHVFCNQSTKRCECLPNFPVNVEDSVCAPALSLGQRCEFDASCKYLDIHSECSKEEQRCRCIHNYMPKVNLTHSTSCVQSGKGIYTLPDYHDLSLLIIVLLSLLLLILTFIAYRLCRKNSTLNVNSLAKGKLTDEIRFVDRTETASPSFVLLDEQQQPSKREFSTNDSDSQISKDILEAPLPPGVFMRSNSYSMLGPPNNNFLQRRPSLSSIQSSFRSYSSFRSNSPYKNFKQIFTNFKRSNNVQSVQDNLCESILVNKPEHHHSFTDTHPHKQYHHQTNGQRLLKTTNRTTAGTDNKLIKNSIKRQHVLNNHLQSHHLNSSLNSNLHHTTAAHRSNDQLNHYHHLNQANYLHYQKEILRPTICTSITENTLNYMPLTGLSDKTKINNNVTNAASSTNALTNISLTSTTANNVLTNTVLNNNQVLKKFTKINDEKTS